VVDENQSRKKKKNANKRQGIKLKDVVFKLIPCLFPGIIENVLLGEKMDP
jgi:hypothetical protein